VAKKPFAVRRIIGEITAAGKNGSPAVCMASCTPLAKSGCTSRVRKSVPLQLGASMANFSDGGCGLNSFVRRGQSRGMIVTSRREPVLGKFSVTSCAA
jgi:hypothetical protein